MIEKAKNGVSHPKNDPPIFFKYFFLLKLNKYNDRKTLKWGKPPQKCLIKKNAPPQIFFEKYFFSKKK